MSRTETIACDGCGKTVIDGKNIGWIRFECTEDYSLDFVRKNDSFNILASDRIDFCSVDCLTKWITNAIKGAKS
jgi:hypothetical protein